MKSLRVLLFVVLALGVAAPVAAWDQVLNDSQEPGSVLVFPKFIRGTVPSGPRTELSISVTCPQGSTCAQFQTVRLMAHWVCPGCTEQDFRLFTTVNGTLYFNPENMEPTTTLDNGGVPIPNCSRGYLIVWVIDRFDRPIKFDGLIGNAVFHIGASSRSSQYNAIPIQAGASLPTGGLTDVNGNGALNFNGTEYKMITGTIYGTVSYETPLAASGIQTDLTLLTLDVRSNRLNNPVHVDLNFYNEFEVLRSTNGTDFTCWKEVRLTAIDPNLTTTFGRKGLVVSTAAFKQPNLGVDDTSGPVTLLGIIETKEIVTGTAVANEHISEFSNDSTPVATTFCPSPCLLTGPGID